MEAEFLHYYENIGRRGMPLPVTWDQEKRADYRRFCATHRKRKLYEAAGQDDPDAVERVERIRQQDHKKRSGPTKQEDPEEHERRRQLARANERRYRERHREKLRARGRAQDATETRKEQKREWRRDNREKVNAEVGGVRRDYAFERCYASATKRNLPFELTTEQFGILMEEPCHYCHWKPLYKGQGGIDRVLNEVGYIWPNCVPCCGLCNFMKGQYPYAKFIAKCKAVAAAHE